MIKWSDKTVEDAAVHIGRAVTNGQVSTNSTQRGENGWIKASKAALAAAAQSKEVQAKDAALIKARDTLEWYAEDDTDAYEAITAINEVL
jgi:hypothetical protein